jgi:hypothetical protein
VITLRSRKQKKARGLAILSPAETRARMRQYIEGGEW